MGVDRQEQADHENVVGWNIAEMTEKGAEAAEKLWMEFVMNRAHSDAECTEEEVEQEVAMCQEAMSSVLDTMVKKIRHCARSKMWWNADIKQRRRMPGTERRRRRNLDEAACVQAEL